MPDPLMPLVSRVALDLRQGASCLSFLIGDEPEEELAHRRCGMVAFVVEAMLRTLETTAARDVAFDHPGMNRRVDLWARSSRALAQDLQTVRESCARDEEPSHEILRALVERARDIDAELRGLIIFAVTEDIGSSG